MEHIDKKIVSVDSMFASNYTSSCDFVFDLNETISHIKYVKLLSGSYPETTERSLFLDMIDFNKKPVQGPLNGRYSYVLRFGGSAGRTNFQDLQNEGWIFKEDKPRLNQIRMKIYDTDSDLHSFGVDSASIRDITSGSPTTIRTTINHGLVNGDLIRIFGVDNMSTVTLNKNINYKWTVTVTAADTFTIPLNTTGEGASQPVTGVSTTPYTLGGNSEIVLDTLYNYLQPATYVTHVNGTQVTTTTAHGLSVGQNIRIRGFDNGATVSDNNKMNAQHTIISIISPTSFTIGAALSAYPVNSPKTGIITYLLGSHGSIRIDKMQCSFDFAFFTEQEIKNSKSFRYHKKKKIYY